MKQADILTKYIEALTTDMPDNQAQLFARSWAEASELHPQAATKQDLRELRMEIMAHFRIVYVVGAAIFASSCLPWLEKIFSR